MECLDDREIKWKYRFEFNDTYKHLLGGEVYGKLAANKLVFIEYFPCNFASLR